MPRLIVLLLWAFREVLGWLFHGHWVLFDAQSRYFWLLVSRLVLYVFIFKVFDAVIFLLIFDIQVVVVSHHILVVRLSLLLLWLWELDLLNSIQIIFLFFLRLRFVGGIWVFIFLWLVLNTFYITIFICQWKCWGRLFYLFLLILLLLLLSSCSTLPQKLLGEDVLWSFVLNDGL